MVSLSVIRHGLQVKLKSLQVEIHDYANYLEESTYHPYDQVEHFAYELGNLIKELECN